MIKKWHNSEDDNIKIIIMLDTIFLADDLIIISDTQVVLQKAANFLEELSNTYNLKDLKKKDPKL